MSSPGVTSFPLVAGDTVATSNGPAVLLFNDGSTVKLSEDSSIKLNTAGANMNVVLLSGNLDYKLAAGSNIKITNVDTVAQQTVTSDSTPAPQGRIASVLSSKAFLVSAGSGATGVASALLASSFSGSSAASTSKTATATMSAKTVTPLCVTPVCPLPPVSICW